MVWQVSVSVFQQGGQRATPRSRDRPLSLWGTVGQGLEAAGRGDPPQTSPAGRGHTHLGLWSLWQEALSLKLELNWGFLV